MDKLLSFLKNIPEYQLLLKSVQRNEAAAVTGLGQINRSHLIAGLRREFERPIVVICQDDMAARRLQEELKAFLRITAPILPSRELTLYDTAVVSRAWEQKRLRQLYALSQNLVPIQIMTWESLSQRTIPQSVLMQAAFTLEAGKEYPIDTLIQNLLTSGQILIAQAFKHFRGKIIFLGIFVFGREVDLLRGLKPGQQSHASVITQSGAGGQPDPVYQHFLFSSLFFHLPHHNGGCHSGI